MTLEVTKAMSAAQNGDSATRITSTGRVGAAVLRFTSRAKGSINAAKNDQPRTVVGRIGTSAPNRRIQTPTGDHWRAATLGGHASEYRSTPKRNATTTNCTNPSRSTMSGLVRGRRVTTYIA